MQKTQNKTTMKNTKISKHILGFIASDHKGIKLKDSLKKSFPLIDLGPFSEESVDYPDYARKLCGLVINEKSRGILICGSGIGMSIAANRNKGIRAALCRTVMDANMTRLHNDANILVLGADMTKPEDAIKIAKVFFTTEFSREDKHKRRIRKLDR
jgi:ribose 5-phosphate isomerase B